MITLGQYISELSQFLDDHPELEKTPVIDFRGGAPCNPVVIEANGRTVVYITS